MRLIEHNTCDCVVPGVPPLRWRGISCRKDSEHTYHFLHIAPLSKEYKWQYRVSRVVAHLGWVATVMANQPRELPKLQSTQPRCMTTMVTLYIVDQITYYSPSHITLPERLSPIRCLRFGIAVLY